MKKHYVAVITMFLFLTLLFVGVSTLEAHNAQGQVAAGASPIVVSDPIFKNAQVMMTTGQNTFRFDTFGDQAFWGDALKLHLAIEGSGFGGVGAGVSPKTALAVGLKVDVDALPEKVIEQLKKGKVNLDDPATTLTLLKLNSVLVSRGNEPLWSMLYRSAPWVISTVLVVIGLLRDESKNVRAHGFFILLCVAIGPGLIVNVALKDHWGRPRPLFTDIDGADHLLIRFNTWRRSWCESNAETSVWSMQ